MDKNFTTDNIEILAPAGNFAALAAAIEAGAQAVFFGVGDMNMRATNTANFQLEDLAEIRKLTASTGVKAYLTLNTILYDGDLQRVDEILEAAAAANLDAVIVADIAAIQLARKHGLEVHISTQLSISNIEGVEFYSQFADRIVLARELNLEQMTQICQQIKSRNITGPKGRLVEIEVFAHGALCVAVSGRCGMSLHCSGTSANRGRCSQVCRRKYKVQDAETGQELVIDNNYVFSSADLCTIGLLDKLLDTAATVLKIEGRGRGAEYVKEVVTCYKQAVTAIADGTFGPEKVAEWRKKLGAVFNRGQSSGLYLGLSFAEWAGVHGNKATKIKYNIGKVERYYPKAKIVQIKLHAGVNLAKGQELLAIGDSAGALSFNLSEIWVDGQIAEQAVRGDVFTTLLADPLAKKLKPGDVVYEWRDLTTPQRKANQYKLVKNLSASLRLKS